MDIPPARQSIAIIAALLCSIENKLQRLIVALHTHGTKSSRHQHSCPRLAYRAPYLFRRRLRASGLLSERRAHVSIWTGSIR
jgi:hypothetical protein